MPKKRSALSSRHRASVYATIALVACAACTQSEIITQACDPRGIVVDSTHIYWTECNRVMKLQKGRDTPAVLADDQRSPYRIAIDSTHVYWVTLIAPSGGSPGGAVWKVPKEGGPAMTLVIGEYWPRDLAVDEDFVYWVAVSGVGGPGETIGLIRRASKRDGGGVTTLAQDLAAPNALAIDRDYVYWGHGAYSQTYAGTVTRVAKTGGDPVALATGLDRPIDIVVDTDGVYLVTRYNFGGAVQMMAKEGGVPTVLATPENPVSVTVDEQFVYWGEYGAIMAISKNRGPLVTVAKAEVPINLTNDAGHLYWADIGFAGDDENDPPPIATIRRAPKP